MKIAILVEGDTELAFGRPLRSFLESRLAGRMPNIDPFPYHGRIPKGDKLRRVVEDLLGRGPKPANAVIALTDVYTGSSDFTDAADAKAKMRQWVGTNDRFYPHAAQYDFEAWPRDALKILKDADLAVAADACGELKAFLNTILCLSGGAPLP